MLREFDLQKVHWADKTQSMLHQRQMEACEARLLSYPTESIFTLQDERETEYWWQCSFDAEESPKSPVLHTCGRCGRMCLRACPWKPRC